MRFHIRFSPEVFFGAVNLVGMVSVFFFFYAAAPAEGVRGAFFEAPSLEKKEFWPLVSCHVASTVVFTALFRKAILLVTGEAGQSEMRRLRWKRLLLWALAAAALIALSVNLGLHSAADPFSRTLC